MCESGVHEAKHDGPTFIARNAGLTRLDGITVSNFIYSLINIALGVNTALGIY